MSIEFKMTFKELKRSLKIYLGYYRTGRIKRMRSDKDKGKGWISVKTIRKIARPELIYKIRYYQSTYPTITRWNRH